MGQRSGCEAYRFGRFDKSELFRDRRVCDDRIAQACVRRAGQHRSLDFILARQAVCVRAGAVDLGR
jgi:hypothetical protein